MWIDYATKMEKLNDISESIENRKQFDAIYVDFNKVFNSVCHSLLIQKLKSYGYFEQCLEWLQSYLVNRKQRVVVIVKASE